MSNHYKLLFTTIKYEIKGGSSFLSGASASGGDSLTSTEIVSNSHKTIDDHHDQHKYSDEITNAFNRLIENLSKYIIEKKILILTQNDHDSLRELYIDEEFIEYLAIVIRFGFLPDFFSFDIHHMNYPYLERFNTGCNDIKDSLNKLLDDDGSTIVLVPGDSPYKIWFCIGNELKSHKALVFPLSNVKNSQSSGNLTKITNLDRFYEYLFKKQGINPLQIKKIIFFDYISLKRTYDRTKIALQKIVGSHLNIIPFGVNNLLKDEKLDVNKTYWYLFDHGVDRCQPIYEIGDAEFINPTKIVFGSDKISRLSQNQILKCNIALLALFCFKYFKDKFILYTKNVYIKYPLPIIRDTSTSLPEGVGICELKYFDWIKQNSVVKNKCCYIGIPCKNKSTSECIEVYDLCSTTEELPFYLSTRNLIDFKILSPCTIESIKCKDEISKEYENMLFDITYYSESMDPKTLEDCLVDEIKDKVFKIYTKPYNLTDVRYICFLCVMNIIKQKASYEINMAYFFNNPKYYSRVSTLFNSPDEKYQLFSMLESFYKEKDEADKIFFSKRWLEIYTKISNINNLKVGSIINYYQFNKDNKITKTVKILCINKDDSSIVMQTEDDKREIIIVNWPLKEPDSFVFFEILE